MLDFLKNITAKGQLNIEYNYNCNSNTKEYKYSEILKKYPDKENLYFATGILNIGENRNSKNIGYVNRITIDIDLRKNSLDYLNYNPTDEEIIQDGINLGEMLKIERPNDFGQWSYIVFSGNGLHIHYLGKIHKVTGELYAEYFREATKHIYKEFSNYFGAPCIADEKVGDLGHLFRLPNTINIKNDIKRECKIIARQNIESNFVNNLDKLLEYAKKRIEKRQQDVIELQKKNVKTIAFEQNQNIFEKIRQEVDVAQVLLKFIPDRPLKKDNKNFSKPGKNGNNSYFVDRQNNIIIRNGSTFLAGNKEGLNPIDIVQEYTSLEGQELLEWFRINKFIK